MAHVKRKDNESFESLIRRFTRKTIESGKVFQVKKIRFHTKPASDRQKKERALYTERTKKERDYLQRIGKLEEKRPHRGRQR